MKDFIRKLLREDLGYSYVVGSAINDEYQLTEDDDESVKQKILNLIKTKDKENIELAFVLAKSQKVKFKKGEIDLRYANLRDVDLSGADLRFADLRNADLEGANLSKADLRYANLTWAYLGMADLSKADLSKADLQGADLYGAHLKDVKGLKK